MKVVEGNDIQNNCVKTYLEALRDDKENELYQSGDVLYIPLTDEAYYTIPDGTVTDLATNTSEKITEQKVVLDHTKPNSEILVQYITNISNTVDDSNETTVRSSLTAGAEKIFASKIIKVNLYIPDNMSMIQEIKYTYAGETNTTTVQEDDALENLVNINGIIYTKVTISLPITDNQDAKIELCDKLAINYVKDMANNILDDNVSVNVLKGNTDLIIDCIAPTVLVEYPTHISDQNQDRIYHCSGNQKTGWEKVTFTYTETFFEKYTDEAGNIIKPEITANKVKLAEKEGDTSLVPYIEWGEYDESEHQIKATVYLPYGTNEEIEYILTTSYVDGSGNQLTLEEGTDDGFSTIANGTLTTGTIVLDNKAPELTKFEITGATERQVNEVDVYKNVSDKDVTISFTINENEKYWNERNLEFKLINKITEGEKTITTKNNSDFSIEHEKGTRDYVGTFKFDGEENPANYQVTVTYKDRSGNSLLKDSSITEGAFEDGNGIYTSEEFILDHRVPELAVSYNDAYRVVNNADTSAANDNKEGKKPVNGYTAYYKEDVVITFSIAEDYAIENEDNEKEISYLEDLDLVIKKDGETLTTLPDITWKKSGNTYTGTFTLKDEGSYVWSLIYHDTAFNKMEYKNVNNGTMSIVGDDGVFTSTTFIIDKTAPKINCSYSNDPSNTVGSRMYFNSTQTTYLTIGVEDEYIRNHEQKVSTLDGITVTTVDGKDITKSNDAYRYINGLDNTKIYKDKNKISLTWKIPLSTEGNYDIPLVFEDLAGNKTVYSTQKIGIDTSDPTDVEFEYSVSKTGYLDFINYRDFGFVFADQKLEVTASTKDSVTGIQKLIFEITDENDNVETITQTFDPSESVDHTIVLPLKTSDFKGSVKVTAVDYATNTSDKTNQQVVESTLKHNSTGKAEITTITKPSRTVNGEDFYNTDITFNLKLEDPYSGLQSYKYLAGSTISGSRNYADEAGDDLKAEKKKNVTYKYSENFTIPASKNNLNNVSVEASFIDNAGHQKEVSQKYNIDITVPTIEVTYDNNSPSNEKYYQANRTATIVITERNFDQNDVIVSITNTDGVIPAISGWTTSGSGDGTKHTATVTFAADGDYTFTVAFQDKAGNKAEYSRVDEFTIDKTLPTYSVSYDNNTSLNGNYFAETRTATIDILEHNFDSSLVNVFVTKDGVAGGATISGWSRQGDHNIATVSYLSDGEYTFMIQGVDQADNAMETYVLDHFVIDTEMPAVSITNIENMSANNGLVQPIIHYSDINSVGEADSAIEISIIGVNNGEVSVGNVVTRTENGYEITINDFEHTQIMDDIYTMTVKVYDLAGNSSEQEIIFSVNRFGSTYEYIGSTKDLVDNYYTKEEQHIIVREINVDTLEFKEITCNLNGSLNTLVEGEDFTVEESGSDVSWKSYTYTIDKENFVNEGAYTLTIYSEDRAENISDNNTKGKKVEFVVDKTAPSIVLSGIKNDGQYRAESHEITIDVTDNIRLAALNVNAGESEYKFKEEDLENGRTTILLKSGSDWQDLVIVARDAAGNESVVKDIRYLISSNFLIQFMAYKPLFYGSIIGLVVIIGGATFWIILLGKKKKKKEEQS